MDIFLGFGNHSLLRYRVPRDEVKELASGLQQGERAECRSADQPFRCHLCSSNDKIVFDKPAAWKQVFEGLFVMLPFRLLDTRQWVLRLRSVQRVLFL